MPDPLKTFIHLEEEPSVIWATNDGGGDRIGLRFDEGDAGKIFLSEEQTAELIRVLMEWQANMGWTSADPVQ